MKNNQYVLYKMHSNTDYSFEALYNGMLYLSKPSQFNDKFDCFIGIDKNDFTKQFLINKFGRLEKANEFAREEIKKSLENFISMPKLNSNIKFDSSVKIDNTEHYKNDKPLLTKEIELEIDNLYNEYVIELASLKNEYYIACFTSIEPNRNMVMWSHYANQYNGFCAKYIVNDETLQSYIYAVDYEKNNIFVDCSRLLLTLPKDLKNNQYIKDKIKEALICKNRQWNYEQEIRIIIHESDLKNFKNHFKKANGVLVHFQFLCELYAYKDCSKYTTQTNLYNFIKDTDIKLVILTESKEAKELVVDDSNSKINSHNFLLKYKHLFHK